MKRKILAALLAATMFLNLAAPSLAADPSSGSGGTAPDDIGGLTVWYDASTIPAEDGDKLAELTNQASTGAEYDAAQADEAYQPEYVAKSTYKEFPAIRMNADSFMQIGGDEGFDLTDMTIVAVMAPRKLVNNQQICSRKKNQSGDHNWYFNLENSGGLNFGWKEQGQNNWTSPNPKPNLSIKTPYTLVGLKNGADGAVYVNGEKTAFNGSETPEYNGQKVFLGAFAGNSDGEKTVEADIVEFLIYNRGLDEAELDELNAYLDEKYYVEEPDEPEPEEPAAPINPDELDGIKVWFDASKIEAEDGDKLSGLTNQAATGAEFDAKQENEAFQPTYVAESAYKGFPAVRMDEESFLQVGGDNGFDLNDMTIVAVMTPRELVNDGHGRQICSRKETGGGNHNWYLNVENGNGLNFGWKVYGGVHCKPVEQPALSTYENYTVIARKSGADGALFVNGDMTALRDTGDRPDTNSDPVYLGAPEGNGDQEKTLAADIAEFIIFDRGLTDEELAGLSAYLEEKYDDTYNPAELEGLTAWFDAADLDAKDGDRLDVWPNKANPGTHDAAQMSEGSRPLFESSSKFDGMPAVRLERNTFFEVTDSAALNLEDFSIFAVVDFDTVSGGGDDNQIFSKLATVAPWNHNWYFNINGGGFNFGWKEANGNFMDYRGANREFVADKNYVLGGVKNGLDALYYINDSLIGTLTSGAASPVPGYNNDPVYIGGTGTGKSMIGNVGEILLFNRALTEEETDAVNGYLCKKWGINKQIIVSNLKGSVELDGEPYRLFSPTTDVYQYVLPKDTTDIPQVSADFSASDATCTVRQAESIPGSAYIDVDLGGVIKTFEIQFSNLEKEILDLKNPTVEEVEITDGFWRERLDVFDDITVDYVLDKLEEVGSIKNFENAGTSNTQVHNNPWNDGLLYETIRAAADFMRANPDGDPELEAKIDRYIDVIYDASLRVPNGVLSTHGNIQQPGKYFDETGNPRWFHEAYNFGCMAEAAVHYYEATGNAKLLFVVTRFAEYVVDNYGYGLKEDGTPKINFIPDHGGPEEMVLKLYQLYRDNPELKELVGSYNPDYPLEINETDYADLVKFWIENRGNYVNRAEPFFYFGDYTQDHARFFDQKIAAGHAVRANLFYLGIAAAGREFEDPTYLMSVDRLWNNIVNKQMYITGGVGATGNEEAYGPDYDLPNDGYCETCAQVAMGFTSEYLGLTFGESKYADIVEKYIYDGVLGGTGLDGKTFFYQQPLSAKDKERWSWDSCPCCPPMFLKLYSELATYIYAYNDSNVYVNQFISSKTTLENGVSIEQTTEMPWGGKTTLKVNGDTTLRVRLPEWADHSKITIKANGADASYATESGYAVLSVSGETTVEVEFPMEARREYSDENVVYNRGKVALAYGPMVYCFESTDHMMIPNFKAGDGNLGVPVDAVLKTQFEPDLLGGIQTITVEGGQYYDSNGQLRTGTLKAIPFYVRANRGRSSTFVWVDEEVKESGGEAKRWLAMADRSENQGSSAAAAFDGDANTSWSIGTPDYPQVLMVDLGSVQPVAKVKTTFNGAQAWKFIVYGSTDGENWTVFSDNSGNLNNIQEFEDIGSMQARYVALKFTQSSGMGYTVVQDVAVFAEGSNTNIALNKLCGATSSIDTGRSAFAMIDGNDETRYCPPNHDKPRVLTFDMGEVADITGMNILFEKPTSWNYGIEVSEDGENWTEYVRETFNMTQDGVYHLVEKEAKGRYIRFTVYETTGGVWASVWEFDVRTAKPVEDLFTKLINATGDPEPGKPDTTELEALIAEAENDYNEVDYTAESWANLQAALTEAKGLIGNDAATQDHVNAAYDKLEAAIGDLVDIDETDFSKLQKIYDAAVELGNDPNYESSALLKELIADAEEMLDKQAATQQEADALAARLETEAAKVLLNQALKDAEAVMAGLDKADYTTASWNNYENKMDALKAMQDNEVLTIEAVKNAVADVDQAFEALKPAVPDPKPSKPSKGSSSSVNDMDYWNGVIEKINAADKGDKINATLESGAMMPATVIDALKGKDATLVVTVGGKDYAINGAGKLTGYTASAVYYTSDEIIAMANSKATAPTAGDQTGNPETGGEIEIGEAGAAVAPTIDSAAVPAPEAPAVIAPEAAAQAAETETNSGSLWVIAAVLAAVLVGGAAVTVIALRKRSENND